jgi:hypothetical protein
MLDSDVPGLVTRIASLRADFAADVDHVVLDLQRVQALGEPIDSEARRDAVEIDRQSRDVFAQRRRRESHVQLAIADYRFELRDPLGARQHLRLPRRTEAPRRDERRDRDVEDAIRSAADIERRLHHGCEIGGNIAPVRRRVRIEARDFRIGAIARHGSIDACEHVVDRHTHAGRIDGRRRRRDLDRVRGAHRRARQDDLGRGTIAGRCKQRTAGCE